MILYHQVSSIRLAKGLYLGYLKLQASLELNRVLVPKKAPNILPNIKVRDCPNVSRYTLLFSDFAFNSKLVNLKYFLIGILTYMH